MAGFLKMLISVAAVPADVGGFFGNPDPELLVRWYVVGAFSPFFRAHAHIDSKRREPYLLDEPYKSMIRDTLKLRYAMLPVWYTAFKELSTTGMPIVRCVSRLCPDRCQAHYGSTLQSAVCGVPS